MCTNCETSDAQDESTLFGMFALDWADFRAAINEGICSHCALSKYGRSYDCQYAGLEGARLCSNACAIASCRGAKHSRASVSFRAFVAIAKAAEPVAENA